MTITCFTMQVGIDTSIFKLIIQFALAAVGSLGNFGWSYNGVLPLLFRSFVISLI